MLKETTKKKDEEIKNLALLHFEKELGKYEKTIFDLLSTKYGITPQEFIVKIINAVKKYPEILHCTPESIFGCVLYFAEIGLTFNTPEGYGYIIPEKNKNTNVLEAVPIIGYRGFIEIAYRNPKVKSIKVNAVYENDHFDYQYGTNEYLDHKPAFKNRGQLIAAYSVVQMEGISPLFAVVHKEQLDEVQKMSKTGSDSLSAYNNGKDVFNIMQAKVPIKLLFKTLPKSGNETLINALEQDNKFDYERGNKIKVTEAGYEIVHIKEKREIRQGVEPAPIRFSVSSDFAKKIEESEHLTPIHQMKNGQDKKDK